VGDLRLDDRAGLAAKLEIAQFDQLPDSALVLAAWLRWGEACVEQLLGGFAFAVWCPSRRELFAARDHVGERPLFYHHTERFFALASMPKGLLAIPEVFQGFDQQRVVDQLSHHPPDWHRSYFKGIGRVPPGHRLTLRAGMVECKSYWHPSQAPAIRYKNPVEYREAAIDVLDRATEDRLRGLGGIGSQLSAGLDSAAVTSSAALKLGERGLGLSAYTYVPQKGFLGLGLPGRLVDEAPGAAEVAALYPNVEHVLVDTAGYDLLAAMQAVTDAADEPILNSVNVLWCLAIMDRARQRAQRTMLLGASGNQTLTFDGDQVMQTYFRRGHWLKLFKLARNLRNNEYMGIKASILLATNGLLPEVAKRWLRARRPPVSFIFSAANPEIVERFDLLERYRQEMLGDLASISEERRRGFEMYDFAPSSVAVEALSGIRMLDPLGDKRLWDFSYGVPPETFVQGGHSRGLARYALRGRLPEATLWRYRRGEQGVDWYLNIQPALPAMREELERMQESAAAREYLDLPRLIRLVETWPASGYEKARVGTEWNFALTRGMAMGYFLRTWEARAKAMQIDG
jgi:asparagine synthase (glutamine-hydrolysing)